MKILTIATITLTLLLLPIGTAFASSVTINAPDTAPAGSDVTATFTGAQEVTITDDKGRTIFSDTGGVPSVTFTVPNDVHFVYITAVGADGTAVSHTITVLYP